MACLRTEEDCIKLVAVAWLHYRGALVDGFAVRTAPKSQVWRLRLQIPKTLTEEVVVTLQDGLDLDG